MENKCLDKNLLVNSGTSQLQRTLAALSASYAKVDERETKDLILFAKKYGAYLNFYDLTNLISGDWLEFMNKDVAVAIAFVASWKTKDFSPFIKYIFDKIQSASTIDDAKKYFKVLFDLTFTLASGLDTVLQLLPDDVDYKEFLSTAISSKLSGPLKILFQYYQSFLIPPSLIIDESSTFQDDLMPVDVVIFSQDFVPSNLPEWQ